MSLSQLIKAPLKRIFNDSQQRTLRRLFHRLYLHFYSLVYGNNLPKLAKAFGADKDVGHYYTKHYQHHFESLHRKKLNILEIGVGGYKNPSKGGESLRMWKAYFQKGHIFGIDIYDKTPIDEYRIKTFTGSQADEVFLKKVASEIGAIDIVVDDGSHQNNHVITSFKTLFPLLNPNGIYVIEDLQTSYWDDENWGGSKDLLASHTSMNFLKSLADGLNYEEFKLDGYAPTYFDKNIISIHFYHNLIFIYKGYNHEGSNLLENQLPVSRTQSQVKGT
jgi:hypothetical protein